MQTPLIKLLYILPVIFLLSLYQITINTFNINISISDLTVLSLILISLITFKLELKPTLLTNGLLFFILICCISGYINTYENLNFNHESFFLNILRILIIIYISTIIHHINKIFTIREIKLCLEIVLVIQALILILLWYFNDKLNESTNIRNSGLFVEPSFFCIWFVVNLCSLFTIYKLYNYKPLSLFPLLFCIFAVIISTSIYGVMSAIFLFFLYILYFFKFDLKFSFKKIIIYSFILITLLYFLNNKNNNSLTYLSDRLSGIEKLEDGSSRQRLLGGALLFLKLTDTNKYFGIGLGGDNINNYINLNRYIYSDLSTNRSEVTFSATNFYTIIILSSGLVGLFTYLIFLMHLLNSYQTGFMGIALLLISVAFGGVYDLWLWIYLLYFYSLKQINDN